MLQIGCGSSNTTNAPASPCKNLQVTQEHLTLKPENLQTPGFATPLGTQPVGIAVDRDGASVWVLATGSNRVLHVMPDGSAVAFQLPKSGDLGLQLSVAPDGTVWVPEHFRNAVASLSATGSARECSLPRKGSEPVATSVGAEGSVWIGEAGGKAIARLDKDHLTEFPTGVAVAEVLASSDGGAWFSVDGAPVLGHVTPAGTVQKIPIGGSGVTLGLLQTSDGAIWAADFNGDRVVKVATDGVLSEWKTSSGAKPQSLALGPGGGVWFTESGKNHIAVLRGTQVVDVYQTGDWPDHMATTADGWAWFTEYYQDRVGRVRLPLS